MYIEISIDRSIFFGTSLDRVLISSVERAFLMSTFHETREDEKRSRIWSQLQYWAGGQKAQLDCFSNRSTQLTNIPLPFRSQFWSEILIGHGNVRLDSTKSSMKWYIHHHVAPKRNQSEAFYLDVNLRTLEMRPVARLLTLASDGDRHSAPSDRPSAAFFCFFRSFLR